MTADQLRSPANPCISASQVRIGMKLRHQCTAAGSGVFEVVSIRTIYGGNLQFKCVGVSELGAAIHPAVVYAPDELVEVVRG